MTAFKVKTCNGYEIINFDKVESFFIEEPQKGLIIDTKTGEHIEKEFQYFITFYLVSGRKVRSQEMSKAELDEFENYIFPAIGGY